jgi:glycopeptide antibiotics resistance protein
MSSGLKKFLVFLPVLLLGLIYVYDHYELYDHVSSSRLLFLAVTLMALYGWIVFEVIRRRQAGYFDIAVQASFFLYVFMILALTGYFNLFREIASQDWWHRMMLRVERKDHVNLKLFKIFRIYKNTDTQIFGNLIMLFPLGIYIPILYKRLSGFFVTVSICFLVAVLIECLQLATKFRSADVDDVFLNTIGASAGALLFILVNNLMKSFSQRQNALQQINSPLA